MNKSEYGVQLLLGTGFDMSAQTALALTFTKPDGSTLTKSSGVTISASPVVTSEGTFAANTYAIYTFVSGDADQAGDWTVRLTYSAGASVHLISDPATFTVGP